MITDQKIMLDKKKAMNKAVAEFQELFYQNFKVVATVKYDLEFVNFRLSLSDLEAVANTLIQDKLVQGVYPEGIRTKSRKADLIQLRGCTFKIARSMGYTLVSIGEYFGFNHATVISIIKKINNLESIKDITVLTLLKTIENECKNKSGDERNIRQNN